MNVLYVDPWCYDGSNLYYYSTGLLEAMSKNAEVTAFVGSRFTTPLNTNYKVIPSFFSRSDTMKRGIRRRLVRGFEYIAAYFKIIKELKSRKYDVVHIEWLLFFSIDLFMMKRIKKKVPVLSLKAHNILPHSTGNKYVNTFRKIYSIPDIVLVHGDKLRSEFGTLFPESLNKVRIQKHGIYMNHDCSYKEDSIDAGLIEKISDSTKVFLFIGRIDYDKGVDRLIDAWKRDFTNSKSVLVIAGKVNDGYDFEKVAETANEVNNIVFLLEFIEDNLFNFLMSNCDVIVLPYREGSMSGVVFSAAEFAKPILCTKFGAVDEYIPENYFFLIENTDENLREELLKIDISFSKSELSYLGRDLRQYIISNYQWDGIGEKLVNVVFTEAANRD